MVRGEGGSEEILALGRDGWPAGLEASDAGVDGEVLGCG